MLASLLSKIQEFKHLLRKRRLLIGALIGLLVFTTLSSVDRQFWEFLEIQIINGRSYLSFTKPFKSLDDKLLFLSFDQKTKKYLENKEHINNFDLNSSQGTSFLLDLLGSFDGFNAKTVALVVDLPEESLYELELEAELGESITPIMLANQYKKSGQDQLLNANPYAVYKKLYRVKMEEGFAYELYQEFSADPSEQQIDGFLDESQEKALEEEARKNTTITKRKPILTKWLNTTRHDFVKYSISDFMTEKLPASVLRDRLIIIISEFDDPEFLDNKLTVLANYMNNKWLKYFSLPTPLLFIFSIFVSLVFVSLVYWARVAFLFTLTFALFTFGQFFFSVFSLHLETVPILTVLFASFVLSNIVELNLLISSMKEQIMYGSSAVQESSTEPAALQQQVVPVERSSTAQKEAEASLLRNMRRKFYCEEENKLEMISLELQEKTVQSLLEMQVKMDEILLSARDFNDLQRKEFFILHHDFNTMIDRLDDTLFALTPFKFEERSGVIDPLRILAEKVIFKSHARLSAGFESDIEYLGLDLDEKINLYRVVEALVNQILKIQTASALNIIVTAREEELIVIINHNGASLNDSSLDFQEIYKRIRIMDAYLKLGTDLTSNHLMNRIEFIMPISKSTQLLMASNYSRRN